MSFSLLENRRFYPSLEALEARYAPATLVNPTTLTYRDVDGDQVTVKVSKGTLDASNFVFNNAFANSGPQQLRKLTLGAEFQGASLSITAVRSAVNGGNGFANVGFLDAIGVDLGAVIIDGDLGKLSAGDPTSTTQALASVSVQSLGRFGITTQASGGDQKVIVFGSIGKLVVKSDIKGAEVGTLQGGIASIFIGGSLLPDDAGNGGNIYADGMGPIIIRGDVVGGAGSSSGAIHSLGNIASLIIGGSVLGSSGMFSSWIRANDNMGPVKINGGIKGGSGDYSAAIETLGNLVSIHVGGTVTGGHGLKSGWINSYGNIGSIAIGGSLIGGFGDDSGQVHTDGNMGLVLVKGSVIGGDDLDTDDAAVFSGAIYCEGNLAGVTIGGSLVGGGGNWANAAGDYSGTIHASGNAGPIKIVGDIIGGKTLDVSGRVSVNGNLAGITVGGSMISGSGIYTGSIRANQNIGAVKIRGSILGRQSGISAVNIASVTVGGSVITGAGNFAADPFIEAGGSVGPIVVKGSLVGSSTAPVVITVLGELPVGGSPEVFAITSLTVKGRVEFANILAGYDDLEGENADGRIGAVVVGGDWIASNLVAGVAAGADLMFGTSDDAVIVEQQQGNQQSLTASIASIVIKGQVLGTVGGSDHFGFVAEQIGSCSIGGTLFSLLSGKSNDNKLLGPTTDVRIREV